MSKHGGPVHISTTRRHYKDKVYETTLLRRSYRVGDKVKTETLANLSHIPKETIEVIRQSLAGKSLVEAGADFEIQKSLPHGHVAALCVMAKKLELANLLGPSCKERDLVLALVIARALRPASKLSTASWWKTTTLAEDFSVTNASTDDVYNAMDWLISRQENIENKLGKRHLKSGGRVLYDLSSSWVEGSCCPLAARGHSRDHKGGKKQIEYGLTCDHVGRPVAIEVFSGNTADPTAFISAAASITKKFWLKDVVMVGDRGMITKARIDALRTVGGIGWITSLRAPAIKALADSGELQMSLFDETNLAEITHPDYPDERLIACRNDALASKRSQTRSDLLDATEANLALIEVATKRSLRPLVGDKIALRVGKVINRYKMAKHFQLDFTDGFSFSRNVQAIDAEAALDGIYVIRASKAHNSELKSGEIVQAYKDLKFVESGFRSLKAIDLDLRPIYHYKEDRVRAHVLICMLSLYLTWHLRQAWAPICFRDENPPKPSDPVAKATRSREASLKAASKLDQDFKPIASYSTLLTELATLTRNTVVFSGGASITKLANPSDLQRRAFDLIDSPIPIRLKAM